MEGWERVQFIMDEQGMNKNSFSKSVGLTNNVTITRIINEKRTPSRATVQKIIDRYPQYNFDWLLTGRGEIYNSNPVPRNKGMEENGELMYLSGKQNELFLQTKAGIKYYELGNGKYKMRVPLVPYGAYARYANDIEIEMTPDRDEWEEIDFIVDRIGFGSYMSFEVKGDSMDDDSKFGFTHGDKVLARELNRIHWKDGLRIEKFKYWVIVLPGTVLIKQIIHQDMETGDIILHSLNPSPEYKDFTVNLDEVQKLFNVIQKIPAPVDY